MSRVPYELVLLLTFTEQLLLLLKRWIILFLSPTVKLSLGYFNLSITELPYLALAGFYLVQLARLAIEDVIIQHSLD